MFDEMNQQNIADRLKAHLMKIPTPAERKFAIGILQIFERAQWYPQVFEQAVKEEPRLRFTGSTFEVDGNPAAIIPPVLVRYDELVNAALPPRQFGTNDALEYIARELTAAGHEMSIFGVKKYVDRGDIPSQLFGRSRVFTQAALDKFVADYLANPPRTGPKGPHKKKESTF